METTLHELAALLLISGVALRMLAFRHRSVEHPHVWELKYLNPKNWKPIWKTASWYEGRGFIYALLSVSFICLGAAVFLIHDFLYEFGVD